MKPQFVVYDDAGQEICWCESPVLAWEIAYAMRDAQRGSGRVYGVAGLPDPPATLDAALAHGRTGPGKAPTEGEIRDALDYGRTVDQHLYRGRDIG